MSHPDHFVVRAPGRVNLIGEHTDYNDGFVLPMAIDRGLRFEVHRRPGHTASFTTDRGEATVEIDVARPVVADRRDWGRYVAGVIAGLQRLGWAIPGFEARITSDLPTGAGLSSSAALEVGVATVIETLCGRSLEPVAKALLCQHAEHEFAGVPCGIMDQFTVTLATRDHALLIDCQSHRVRQVPLCDEVAVLVIDSGVKHALSDGGYAARRRECEAAARRLNLASLRGLGADEWPGVESSLPEPERRRARHVVRENTRVLAFAASARAGDWPTVGRLMNASHASLRDDFEVSCRELDDMSAAMQTIDGVFGCRMTGGGFGGCAVAIIEAKRSAEVLHAARAACGAVLGREPVAFFTTASAGARVEDHG